MKGEKQMKKIIMCAAVIAAAAVVLIIFGFILKNRYEKNQKLLTCIQNGERYLSELDYEAAKLSFQTAVDIEPNYRALVGLARSYEGSGEYGKAEVYYEQAMETEPSKEDSYIALAELYIRQEKLEEAEELLAQAAAQFDNEEILDMYAWTMPQMPEVSVEPGTYTERQMVELFTTGKEEFIYYTLDGEEPTKESRLYTEGIILRNGETIIKAVTYNSVGYRSEILEVQYVIEIETEEVIIEDSVMDEIVRIILEKNASDRIYNDEIAQIKQIALVGDYLLSEEQAASIVFEEHGYQIWNEYVQEYTMREGNLESLEALQNMPFLHTLLIANQKNLQLAGIEKAQNLKNLSLIHDNLTAADAVGGVKHLKKLCLGWNRIQNITFLNQITGLESLGIWGNQITDISPAAQLKELRYLDFSDNKVEDISSLGGLQNLQSLWAYNNQIKTLDVLEYLQAIRTVMLRNNPIEDKTGFDHIFPRLYRTDIMPEGMEDE